MVMDFGPSQGHPPSPTSMDLLEPKVGA